jgi:hypothetical protein
MYPFTNLPPEIRTQIWHLAAQLPRTLDLWRLPIGTLSFHATYPNQQPNFVNTYRFCTTRRVPSLLHVNKESRAIALQHYVLAFGCTNIVDEDQGITMTAPARTYVNWRMDTILFLGARGDDAIPDALTSDVPAEGASIAIEVSWMADPLELTEVNAISGNDRIREVIFYNSELPEGMQLAFKLFDRSKKRPKSIEFVELEDWEEQRRELLFMFAKEELEFQFQRLEEIVEADYWLDDITLEKAQERQERQEALKRIQRRLVVRFGKLLIDGKSCRESGAWNLADSVSP